jgi:Holliday junction DNA helicase RuvA
VISKITGVLRELGETLAWLDVGALQYEVLITDFTRRQIMMQVGKAVTLFTIDYLDGNIARGGRLSPRLIGFSGPAEREFFESFCSVDGVGVKTALRALVRPVQDVARAIEQQDVKSLSTLPGIGPATAERIVAKLRRKMAKFALLVPRGEEGESPAPVDVVDETYQLLMRLGHSESDARKLLDQALAGKRQHKTVEELIHAVYEQTQRGA